MWHCGLRNEVRRYPAVVPLVIIRHNVAAPVNILWPLQRALLVLMVINGTSEADTEYLFTEPQYIPSYAALRNKFIRCE